MKPVAVPKRVVSLIASATEIVAALDCEDWLVGRSHECDYPPSILDRPVCSAPRIAILGNSREIYHRVKPARINEILAQYGSTAREPVTAGAGERSI